MTTTITTRLNGISSSLGIKAPVKAATTVNITLSGEQTIDGVDIVDGDRVLVKDQNDSTENGIYDCSTGAWTRSKDWDGNGDAIQGTQVNVANGTVNANRSFRVTTETFTIGSNNLDLGQVFFETEANVTASGVNAAAAAASAAAASASASAASSSASSASSSASTATTQAGTATTQAAAAAASASAADASATAAAASAASLTGTSTTSLSITVASKTFTTQASKFFAAGNSVTITSDANPTVDNMFGTVTSYSGTTLIVNVLAVNGSGTHTDWTIKVSGARGAQGAQGAAGAGTGDMLGANNLSDVVTPATARTNLGCGTMAVQAASNVAITGGAISGITDLAVADGGTGSSTASDARTALGLTIGTNVQAYDAELTALAGLTSAADKVPYFTGPGTAALAVLSAAARTVLGDASFAAMLTTLGGASLTAGNTFAKAQIGGVTALSSSGNSIATDLSLNNNFSHTFTENTTLANPTNVVAGQSGRIFFTQHASSPKTLAFGSYWLFPATENGGADPAVTATNSAIDVLYYDVLSSTQISAHLAKGLA